MEENLHSLVEGLSPGVAKRLRKKLKSHIGQPVMRYRKTAMRLLNRPTPKRRLINGLPTMKTL